MFAQSWPVSVKFVTVHSALADRPARSGVVDRPVALVVTTVLCAPIVVAVSVRPATTYRRSDFVCPGASVSVLR